ncbi:MAG: M57 family metalloprotease [Arcobacteraceae bacterium]
MIYKIFFSLLLLLSSLFASVQNIRVGAIDNYYVDKITPAELQQIIEDIEKKFESQLNFDVFNYSSLGVPIDILYIPEDKLEKQVVKNLLLLEQKQEKINTMREAFLGDEKLIKTHQKNLNKFAFHINRITNDLNKYIKDTNKIRTHTKEAYKTRQLYIEEKQKRIDRDVKSLHKERRVLQRNIDKYNNNIRTVNRLVKEYNNLATKTIKMNRYTSKVKGSTFVIQKVSLDTLYENGKKVEKKSVENSVSKIEIYGFESTNKLKAIIAHEIGHLVGIPHIDVKNALMNPTLQDNQVKNLSLTQEDIRNFKENF